MHLFEYIMQLTDTLSHNTCSVREQIFRLHVEKVVVTVTTTFKSGGEMTEMSPPSHTKLRLLKFAMLHLTYISCIVQLPGALPVDSHQGLCTRGEMIPGSWGNDVPVSR